ncbi:MAG TPA: hypothetical protein VHW02_07850 [Rhizomicrobium sp.]|jgi:hypothetical protein|nr:hypothetical protein [Rhizomicrobium sp.]
MAAASKDGAANSREIVARGRSIIIAGETYSAGDPVMLDGAEAKRLRKLGFIDDPRAKKAEVRGNGPVFTPQGGPTIHRMA